jgi:hypothetical protein
MMRVIRSLFVYYGYPLYFGGIILLLDYNRWDKCYYPPLLIDKYLYLFINEINNVNYIFKLLCLFHNKYYKDILGDLIERLQNLPLK